MSGAQFIGVVCGLKSEAYAIRQATTLSTLRIGVSGADAGRAEDIAREFCSDGAAVIVSFGVSGGLDPKLVPGDLLIGDRVIDQAGKVFSSHIELLKAVVSAPFGAEMKTGALFGSDEIIASADQKAGIFQNLNCLAVDMESHGAARAAVSAGVPFMAMRAIADPADRALPPAALGAVAPDGSTRSSKH